MPGRQNGDSAVCHAYVIFLGIMIYGIMGFILGPVSYCIMKALILHLKIEIERGTLKNT